MVNDTSILEFKADKSESDLLIRLKEIYQSESQPVDNLLMDTKESLDSPILLDSESSIKPTVERDLSIIPEEDSNLL